MQVELSCGSASFHISYVTPWHIRRRKAVCHAPTLLLSLPPCYGRPHFHTLALINASDLFLSDFLTFRSNCALPHLAFSTPRLFSHAPALPRSRCLSHAFSCSLISLLLHSPTLLIRLLQTFPRSCGFGIAYMFFLAWQTHSVVITRTLFLAPSRYSCGVHPSG